MGLLDKLKSLFRSDSNSQSARSPPQDGTTGTEPDVTIEREPSAESEHAVKGTDQSPETGSTAADTATESAAATTAEPEPEVAESETEADRTEEVGDETPEETTDETAEEMVTETPEEELTDEETPAVPDEPAASVQEIKGIGPTYTERLEAAGIETVADLAASDAATVAEAAEATEGRAADWIERAKAF
jgi:predicted flap endonuclease-1-like 5' DNA nuclease